VSAGGEATWLVLGGSSAIARAFAVEAARRGHDVILAGRDAEDLERTAADLRVRFGRGAETLPFDAVAYEAHEGFVDACRRRAAGRRLDVFLAFGLMPSQEEIDRDFALARATIEANYLGAVSVLARLAPVLEAQRGGRVVVLGSVAGDRGRLKNYVYGSAKAGLAAYVQGLAARLLRSGVTVTLVKPGPIDTAMTWGAGVAARAATPEGCARACLRAAGRGVGTTYYPPVWRPIMAILRHVPEKVFRRFTF
jgi:short-subunit dehydrogenase